MAAVLTQPLVERQTDVDHAHDALVRLTDQKIRPRRHPLLARHLHIISLQLLKPALIVINIAIQRAGAIDVRLMRIKLPDELDRILFPADARHLEIQSLHMVS